MKRNLKPYACALMLLGILGFFAVRNLPRQDTFKGDSEIFYVVGKAWLIGASPYNANAWHDVYSTFHLGAMREYLTFCVYPPSVAFIASPLALGSFQTFRVLAYALSFILCIGMLLIASDFIARRRAATLAGFEPWIFLMLSVPACGALLSTLQIGQMGIVALAAGVGAYWAWSRRFGPLTAVLVAFSLVKPHVSAPIIAYLTVADRNRGALSGIALGIAAMVVLVVRLPGDVLQAARDYLAANAQFSSSVIDYDLPRNFQSIAGLFGEYSIAKPAAAVSALFAVTLGLALGLTRRYLSQSNRAMVDRGAWSAPMAGLTDPAWHLALLLGITVAFVPLHPYDYVHLMLLIALLPALLHRRHAFIMLAVLILAGKADLIVRVISAHCSQTIQSLIFYLPHVMHLLAFGMLSYFWYLSLRRQREASLQEAAAS